MKKQILKSIGNVQWIHIHSDMNLSAALYLKRKTGAKLFYAVRCNDITRAKILMKHGGYSLREKLETLVYMYGKKNWREKKIARHADCVTFQNEGDKNFFIARTKYDPGKTVLIPGNIGSSRFLPEWEKKNHSSSVKKLVYVGPLAFSKGFNAIIDLMDELKDRGHRNVRVYILGRTNNRADIFSEIKKRNLDDYFIFTGYVNPFSYFADCDLMVYPTYYDAWPDAVLEALYTGCPTIASAVGGLPDLLEYPELLFEPGNVIQMADMVERAIKDPDYYNNLRMLCDSRVPHLTFDWVAKFEEVMQADKECYV